MKSQEQSSDRLRNFYFGSLDEDQRLAVEREMLLDSEVLVEYLDLKRRFEAAQEVPQRPSPLVKARLVKLFLSPRARVVIPFSLGIALAAGLFFFFFIARAPQTAQPNLQRPATSEILFDGAGEPSSSNGVL